MTSTSSNYSSIDLTSEALGQFYATEAKNKEKSNKALTELAALLQKLEGVMSHGADVAGSSSKTLLTGSSDASGSSGSSATGNTAGTTAGDANNVLQAAQNLAVIEQFLNQLAASTSNQNEKNFLTIEAAQLQAMAAAYKEAEQQLTELTQGMNQFQQLYHNLYYRLTSNGSYHDTSIPPNPTQIQNGLQKIFNECFPGMNFTFNIDPDTQTWSSVQEQVDAQINAFVSNSTNSIMSSLNALASTPFLKEIAEMMNSGGALSAAELQLLAKLVQQCVKAITTEKASNGPESSNGPSNTLFVSIMSMMSEAMSNVQAIIAQSASQKGQLDQQIGQAMLTQAQQNLNHIQNEIQKIANEEAAEKSLGIFMKVITAVVTAVVAAACLATGNVGMAVMAVALCVAQETGGFSALSGQIADLLEDMGVSSNVAKWVADATVIVLTILLTIGAGAIDSAGTVADEAADAATTAGSDATAAAGKDAAVDAAEDAANAAETASSETENSLTTFLKKAWELFMKVNPFSRLSAMTNMAIVNSMQAAMGTNIVSDVATYVLTEKGYTQDQIQSKLNDIDKWASIAMGIVMFLSGTAMANGIANTAGETATNDLNTTMGKLRQSIQDFMQSSNGLTWMTRIQTGVSIFGAAGQTAGGIATGVYQKEQAESTAQLGTYEALQQIIQMVQTASSTDATQTAQASGATLSINLKNNISNLNKIYGEGALVAQILAQQAV